MQKIVELERKIREAAQAYYEGNPIIDDTEFDKLIDKLRTIDPDNSLLKQVGWGYNPKGNKVKHKTFIGSLPKYTRETLHTLPESSYCITPKLDGGSLTGYYDKGKLQYVLTRGDGNEGLNVTPNVRHLFPEHIELTDPIIVRGEVLVTNKDFNNLECGYANPRNLAVGLVMSKNLNVSMKMILRFVAYTVLVKKGDVFTFLSSKANMIDFLNRNGFQTVKYKNMSYQTIQELFTDSIDTTNKDNLLDYLFEDYPTDGLVLTSNDEPYLEYAYKFMSETAETYVTNIVWNLNPTGKFTPKIFIKPVNLSGACVSVVTGNSINFIKNNNVSIGSKVIVTRSNEVIPKLVKVLEPGSGETNIPKKCPSCGEELCVVGAHLYCTNGKCPSKHFAMIQAWWDYFRADSAGQKTLELLLSMWDFDFNSDSSVKDFFANLRSRTKETIKYLNSKDKLSHQEKVLLRTLENVDNTKSLSVEDFMLMIRYPGYGISAIQNDLSDCKTLDEYLSQLENPIMIRVNILKQAFDIDFKNVTEKGQVAITGRLSMPRDKFQKMLREHGWKVGSITKNTKFLIANQPSNSSKFRKAKEFGIKVVSEEEFVNNYM